MDDISIFFIGDTIGKPGLDFLQTWFPSLKQKYQPDFIIANGENASDGKGITKAEADIFYGLGVQVITGGNHTWDKRQSQEYIQADKRALRPFNYPRGTHGEGYIIAECGAHKIGVLNLQGRTFMTAIDCPFRSAEYAIAKIKKETNIVVIDFHAEATAEKIALASFLDGKVSTVFGTHTHVQTADERILPGGTGYITDVGMTGPYESVIGMKTQAAINRFLYQTPQKYETAQNEVHICGLFFKVNPESGKTTSIERVFFPDFIKQA
jgi:hypothetical protein